MRPALALIFFALASAGVALQFTARDSVDALAPLFYAVPLPVAGAGFLAAAILGRRPLRGIAALAGGAVLAGWFLTDYGFAEPKRGAWKFATWNLQGARHPSPLLLKIVRTEWPDFMALLEAGPLTPAVKQAYEKALPGYRLVSLGDDRACLMRGNVVAGTTTTLLPGRTRVVTLRMLLRGAWMKILVVDLDSGIFLSRRAALNWITATAGKSPRTVVLGDFNTPLNSAHLDELRAHFAAATEGAHAGFRETWPYGAPLLPLDQIWLSRDFQPLFARRIFTLASDHTPVIATFGPK
jgi:endonuclease/exonuclease/phosphatase (EEP) superfamily protein YafD